MDYDVDVFSTEEPVPPPSQEGRGWQISVHGPLLVEPEDMPAHAHALLPGLRFLTQFHLEGDAGARTQTKKLLTMARDLARRARGVVVDQQQGTVETPRGVQRLAFEPDWDRGDLVQLSWFVEDVGPLARSLPAGLLDAMQRAIPEMLPRRYGLFEPPQFKLATDGIDHLRHFLEQHLGNTIVWYGHKPCRYVYVSLPPHVGATPQGFRCGRLTVDVDGKAASDRAWRTELTRLWLTIADLIQPFYAEIRLAACPTKGWWWNGIPTPSPSAMALGKPYTGLWPQFASAARSSPTGLHYIEQFVEIVDAAANGMPAPPTSIAQPSEPVEPIAIAMLKPFKPLYPEVWPFEGPFSQTWNPTS